MTRSKTVLVTGASGFLGHSLRQYLDKKTAYQVVATTRRKSRSETGSVWPCHLDRFSDVVKLLRSTRPDVIFHCAGTTKPAPWAALRRAHVTATDCLLKAVNALSLQKNITIVVAGSAAEYGDVPLHAQPIRENEPSHEPLSLYGRSKSKQATLCATFAKQGGQVIYARLFNLIGPGQASHFAIPSFIRTLSKRGGRKPKVQTGSLEAVRDFVSVEDACRALVSLSEKGKPGEIYNVCSGQGTSMRTIFDYIVCHMRQAVDVEEKRTRIDRTCISASVGHPDKIRKQTGWKTQQSWTSVLDRLL